MSSKPVYHPHHRVPFVYFGAWLVAAILFWLLLHKTSPYVLGGALVAGFVVGGFYFNNAMPQGVWWLRGGNLLLGIVSSIFASRWLQDTTDPDLAMVGALVSGAISLLLFSFARKVEIAALPPTSSGIWPAIGADFSATAPTGHGLRTDDIH